MKIGVLIATYNGERYLQEQLDSIIEQTKRVDEIIVSDDNSSDNTAAIVNQYIENNKDIRIKFVINQGKRGVTCNFENAFRHSTSDLLFFCDQDDVWNENKVSCFLEAAERFPEYGLYFSNATLTDGSLKPIGKSVWDVFYCDRSIKTKYSVLDGDKLIERISANNIVTGMSAAVRREVLQNVFPMHLSLYHDEMVACYCSVNGGLVAINEETALYRQHGNNAIGIDGSMYVSDEKRRNSIAGLIKYSDQNMPIINHLYYKCEYYLRYDKNKKYDFLKEQYDYLKQIHDAAVSNKLKGTALLLGLLLKGKYNRYDIHRSTKFFVLDLAMVLFVGTKKRRKYFIENG